MFGLYVWNILILEWQNIFMLRMAELENLSRQNTECQLYIEKKRGKTQYTGVKELFATHLHTQPRFETIYAILERQEYLLQEQKALIEQQKVLIEHQIKIIQFGKQNKIPPSTLH